MLSIEKRRSEEAVSPVIAIILMVAITVVLTGVLYVWVGSLADTDSEGGENYILFDSELHESTAELTLFMRTGDIILWKDYQFKFNNTEIEISEDSFSVGDTIIIPILAEYGISVVKGEEYPMMLIHIEKKKIMWEDKVVSKG